MTHDLKQAARFVVLAVLGVCLCLGLCNGSTLVECARIFVLAVVGFVLVAVASVGFCLVLLACVWALLMPSLAAVRGIKNVAGRSRARVAHKARRHEMSTELLPSPAEHGHGDEASAATSPHEGRG